MLENKSNTTSEQFKNEGNKSLSKKLYYQSLIAYNKALCFAESKTSLACGYANRSLVYFELRRYEECLLNISWAREHKFSCEQKLIELKNKCEKLMKEIEQDESENLLANFLKLSHPINPKIPFLIDGLNVVTTENFGRGIFTSKDLKAGDIICIEDPIVVSLCQEGQYHRCCKCLKVAKLNLIPCSKTASLMFCSPSCRDKTYKHIENVNWMISDNVQSVHFEKLLAVTEEAFHGHNTLMKFLQQNYISACEKTIFDYDFTVQKYFRMNQIKSSLSLLTSRDENHRIADAARTVTNGNPMLEKFIKHFAAITERNFHFTKHLSGTIEGVTFSPFYSLINHSCCNNIAIVHGDTQILCYVVKPIKAGEQLFLNYLGLHQAAIMSTSIRQEKLCSEFDFICDCETCTDVSVDEDTQIDVNKSILTKAVEKAKFSRYIMKDHKDIIKEIIRNWKIINNDPLSPDCQLLSWHSHFLLQFLLTYDVEPIYPHDDIQ